jgi:hypothetical protein
MNGKIEKGIVLEEVRALSRMFAKSRKASS